MKALGAGVWSPQHAGKFQALMDKWIHADQAHAVTVASEFDAAKLAVQKILDEHEQQADKAPAPALIRAAKSATMKIATPARVPVRVQVRYGRR